MAKYNICSFDEFQTALLTKPADVHLRKARSVVMKFGKPLCRAVLDAYIAGDLSTHGKATEAKLRQLSNKINGHGHPPMELADFTNLRWGTTVTKIVRAEHYFMPQFWDEVDRAIAEKAAAARLLADEEA